MYNNIVMLNEIFEEFNKYASPKKAKASQWFFKTGVGQYGEGDQFIGLTVPEQRVLASKYKDLLLIDLQKLLASPIHEHRLTALLILVAQYQKDDPKVQKQVYDFYLSNLHQNRINNWDLIDSSTPNIVGKYLFNQDRKILYQLARSENLWEKRVAVLATFYFIKYSQFTDALKIAEILLSDKHDLIHKAVGWVLREVGKKDLKAEEEFLEKHYKTMPRTMLRYAIERFTPTRKAYFMKK